MVELKRWVAKDATDHGQIVSDPDLTNENIFERLEMDVQFRSVATMLLQRYGYLIPKLNPESDAAKEHELLIAERTKRLAQMQEEELAKEREADAKNLQQLASCDRQQQEECNIPQNQTTPAGGFGQGPQQGEPSNGILPGAPNPYILQLPNTGGNPDTNAAHAT